MAEGEVSGLVVIDGMPVTRSHELPPEADDLTGYKPIRAPYTPYRRFGRGRQASDDPSVVATAEASQPPWSERVRRQLANKRHPAEIERELRCARAHRLLWLVRSEWGLVPITHTSDDWEADQSASVTPSPLGGEPIRRLSEPEPPQRFLDRFHGQDVEPGRPRTLREWPEDQPLPPASCPCYAEVVLTAADARKLRDTPRRTILYRGSGRTV